MIGKLKNTQQKTSLSIYSLEQTLNNYDLGVPVFPLINLYSVSNTNIVFTKWNEAQYVCNIPVKSRKIFYMYDLDWHKTILNYEEQMGILKRCDKIFCRCEDHCAQIYEHFNIKAEILEEYNYERLMSE